MSQPTTLVLNNPAPFDSLGENSRIVLGVLREDGWTIDRVDGGKQLLLCAVPYLTKREEEVQAARIQAMNAAHEARVRSSEEARKVRVREELRRLRNSAVALSLLPLLYGGCGVFLGTPDAFFTFFGGAVLLNSALGFLFHEKRSV